MQLSSSHAKLLDNLGIEIDKAIDDVKEFIRTIVYSGKKSEGYVETRVTCIPKSRFKNITIHTTRSRFSRTMYKKSTSSDILLA